eukprot:446317-Alexandrium_andersonii.AAC.1
MHPDDRARFRPEPHDNALLCAIGHAGFVSCTTCVPNVASDLWQSAVNAIVGLRALSLIHI